MATKHYTAFLELDDNGEYGVFFPDFLGLTSSGATVNEAIANAAEGLAFHVERMQKAGEPIPEPGMYDELPDWLQDEVDPLMLTAVIVPLTVA